MEITKVNSEADTDLVVLDPENWDRAILDAYLKRFASVQDFLGAKIFPLLVDISGITANSIYNLHLAPGLDSSFHPCIPLPDTPHLFLICRLAIIR